MKPECGETEAFNCLMYGGPERLFEIIILCCIEKIIVSLFQDNFLVITGSLFLYQGNNMSFSFNQNTKVILFNSFVFNSVYF